jgi:hypothetical protein
LKEKAATVEAMPQNETGPNQATIKTFPLRGEWQQYRLAASTKFSCCRCEKPKVSKLVAKVDH